MLTDNKMGAAGSRVVIEDFLEGEEASFIVMVDGRHALALATSQDHKRLKDGDAGPNTGGMGAYSPAPVVTPSCMRKSCAKSSSRRLPAWRRMACRYVGFLYAGLMIDKAGRSRCSNSTAAWATRKRSRSCCASRVIC